MWVNNDETTLVARGEGKRRLLFVACLRLRVVFSADARFIKHGTFYGKQPFPEWRILACGRLSRPDGRSCISFDSFNNQRCKHQQPWRGPSALKEVYNVREKLPVPVPRRLPVPLSSRIQSVLCQDTNKLTFPVKVRRSSTVHVLAYLIASIPLFHYYDLV